MNNTHVLKSEVEINASLIAIGDVLYYSDASNCQKWTVTNVFEGGFEAENENEFGVFLFSELQIGWAISEKTKQHHALNDRFQYA